MIASRVVSTGSVAAIAAEPRRRPDSFDGMEIVAAVFIENIELRQAAGPSTRIDLTGVHFSMAAPTFSYSKQ